MQLKGYKTKHNHGIILETYNFAKQCRVTFKPDNAARTPYSFFPKMSISIPHKDAKTNYYF